MDEIQNKDNNKHHKMLIIAIVAAVVILTACVGAYAYTQMTKVGTLTAQVNAEGWNKDTSTPVELAIYQGDVKDALTDDDESNDPEAFKSVVMDANTPWGLEGVTERGTYTLEIEATPVLEDGTLFKEPELQVITLEGENITATFDLEKLDLEKASAEEVEEATKKAEEAAKDSGNEAAVAAAATATKKATEKAPATSNKDNSSSSSSNKGSSSSDKGSSSGSSSSSSKPSSGGSSSGGSSSSVDKPSKPVHEHNWVYHAAVTKEIKVCNDCGIQNPSKSHLKEELLNGGSGGTHSEIVTTQNAYYSCSCGATK